MAAGLSFKIGADTTRLGRGLNRAEGMVSKFGRSIKKLGMAGLAAGAAGAALAMTGLAVAARGVKKALDLGGRLSDVAANTGLLAGQAMVLERAFRDTGLSGEKLQPTITKMQRSIVEGGEGLETYAKAFRAIGLSTDDLLKMKPAEQFEAIQQGISNLASPAERSARAMQIFGKSGSELGALFSDKNALSKAAVSVGRQADIMNENAEKFDRASDILGGLGDKVTGFFVGMAAEMGTRLLPILEEMNKIDLAKYGEAVGSFVRVIAEAFSSGELGGMIKLSLIVAAKEFVNRMWAGMRSAVGFFTVAMMEGVKMAWSKVMDPAFWSGVAMMFKAAWSQLEAVGMRIVASMPGAGEDAEMAANSLQSLAAAQAKFAMDRIKESGDGRGIVDVLKEAAAMAAAEYEEAMKKPMMGTEAEKKQLADLWQKMKESADAAKAAREAEKNAVPDGGETPPVVPKPEVDGSPFYKPVVTSLQRIGGAAVSGVALNLDRQRNNLLASIDRKVGQPTVARFA